MQPGSQTIEHLREVAGHFKIAGEIAHIAPYGSGHINDTYHVINTDTTSPDYLMQRINSYVFKNVPLLISNIEIVTSHIKGKLQQIAGSQPDKQVLTLIKSSTDQPYYIDHEGSYWRMYLFLKETRSYDLVTTTKQASEGGKAFGKFQSFLSDLDAELIGETIPNFHNIEMRLEKFKSAQEADSEGRMSRATTEIAFLMARAKKMCAILELGRAGKLPLRITHNDTKFNNVLLDSDDREQCVIDLDTVMPGYVAYDFGDAIRTIVNTAAEDEADTSKIDVNLELFEAFAQGFLKETAKFLSAEEINSLPMGALLLPYIVGVRFLTDYLEGDHYFKTKFPHHNLQRARAQIRLLSRLEDNYDGLQSIVQKAAQEYGSIMLINN